MEKSIAGYTYENGKRIVMQRISYSKSDDLFALAELYRQHETLQKRVESTSTEPISEEKLQEINEQKTRLESKIKEQQIIVDGYALAAETNETATLEK